MKPIQPWSRSRAIGALASGVLPLAACALVLGPSAWRSPSFPLALGAGLLTAIVAGAIVTRPLVRRLAVWDARLREATARLEDAERKSQEGRTDPLALLDGLEIPAPAPDEVVEEALSELGAALQDEERLRERRRAREGDIRSAIRSTKDLGGGEGDPVLTRLPALLADVDTGVRAVRDACDGVLQQTIASGEVSQMLWNNTQAGKETCSRATTQTAELEARIESFSKLVRRLEGRSREIGQVLLVLNDITEQTNLLALNAAIIAAQAGERGQGFGVVADEMRNLSERASSSTKETEILARTLQDDVTKASQNMSEAAEAVKRLRQALAESQENGTLLADLGRKNVDATRTALGSAERQAADARDLAGKLRELREVKERLEVLDRERIVPMRTTLAEVGTLLEELWQLGALRDNLKSRLEGGMQAFRDHRGRESRDREALRQRILDLRESGRAWRSALEDGRHRDDLVRDLAREIHTLAIAARDR
jgi:hypothetical protein